MIALFNFEEPTTFLLGAHSQISSLRYLSLDSLFACFDYQSRFEVFEVIGHARAKTQLLFLCFFSQFFSFWRAYL